MIFLQNIYVKEMEKQESTKIGWKNFFYAIQKKCNRIKIEEIAKNNDLYIVPNLQDKNILKKLERKVQKKQEKQVQLIFSKKAENLKEQWRGKKVDIAKFKKVCLPLVLKYILEQMQQDEKALLLQDIYFCAKVFNEENKQVIEYFLEKVKTVNIITKEWNTFYKLEEKYEKEKGIWITVSNNKRKSLSKATWIVNLDFSAQELENYQINRRAIIVNCTEEKIEELTGFEGIVIQSFEINCSSPIYKKLEEKFETIILMASQFPFTLNYEENVRKLKEMKVNLRNLIGINGKINQKELLDDKKFLTNKNM